MNHIQRIEMIDYFIVVSYDIKGDKRRTKISKTLLDFGTRVQYSVFECLLKANQLVKLKGKINSVVKNDEDTVRFYQLCQSCKEKIHLVGVGKLTENKDFYII